MNKMQELQQVKCNYCKQSFGKPHFNFRGYYLLCSNKEKRDDEKK